MKYHVSTLALAVAMTVAGQASAQTAAEKVTSQSPVRAPGPGEYDERFQDARELAQSGRHEEAIHAYSELLAHSPGNVDVLLGRGRVYAWMGRWREAENDLRAAVTVSPTYADAWSALGDMYMWSNRPGEAAEAFGRWIQLHPDQPAPRVARGRALRAAGDYSGARADFEAARARGAEAGQVAGDLQALMPRVQKPEVGVPEGYHWSASLLAKRTAFSPQRDGWNDYTLSLRRHFERGSLAVEFLDARRFGLGDQAWALDGYAGLWHRAYANLRYQHAPQGLLYPDRAWRVEIYQGFGQGWEISASYDRLEFAPPDVGIHALGLGRYVGNFYVQGRTTRVSGNESPGFRGLVRYYYAGNDDSYVEVSAGTGRSSDELARTLGVTDTIRRSSIGIALVRYWNPRWGFKIAADHADEERGYTERGISATLYRRW